MVVFKEKSIKEIFAELSNYPTVATALPQWVFKNIKYGLEISEGTIQHAVPSFVNLHIYLINPFSIYLF